MIQSPISEHEILERAISPDEGDLAPEVARSILNWRFTDDAIAHMSKLAKRNSNGSITPEERQDLEKYLRVGSLLNIAQAKARLSLSSAGAGT